MSTQFQFIFLINNIFHSFPIYLFIQYIFHISIYNKFHYSFTRCEICLWYSQMIVENECVISNKSIMIS